MIHFSLKGMNSDQLSDTFANELIHGEMQAAIVARFYDADLGVYGFFGLTAWSRDDTRATLFLFHAPRCEEDAKGSDFIVGGPSGLRRFIASGGVLATVDNSDTMRAILEMHARLAV